MIYPSGRAVALAAAGAIPALVLALVLPGIWHLGLLWICGLLAFLMIDAVAGPGKRALNAQLGLPVQVGVGGMVLATVDVGFAGQGPRRIEVRVGHDNRLVPQTRPDREIVLVHGVGQVVIDFTAVRRGTAMVDRMWLRWRGPFGLLWKQVVLATGQQVSILPDVSSARDQAITLLQRDAMAGDHDQRRAGQGGEFEALKEYQPGMGRRMIDWKRSARHGKLLAREFRTEQNNSIVLAVDSGRLMCEPVGGVPKVDRAVTAALLTAFIALKGGDMVRLFGFDSRPKVSSGAVRGVGGFAMVQQLAATIDYSSEETNFTLALTTLGAGLDRRSLVIIFTDFVDPISAELMLRTVGRLTERHLVLFMLMKDVELEQLADAAPATPEDVARAVTAGAMLRERRIVTGRLRALGAQVIETDYDRLGPALVERYLALKRGDVL